MSTKRMYIDMPFKDALAQKFADGAAKHRQAGSWDDGLHSGSPVLSLEFTEKPAVFDGNEFNELFSEQLDVIHYCDFITAKYGRFGIDLTQRRQTAVAFALEIQGYHRNLEKFLTPLPGI